MKKVFIGFIIFVSLGGIIVYQLAKFNDGKFHVVFCDVGQGDAIFLRTPKGMDILVDGGPDNKLLSCLSSRMPFWDRDLELVVLTHPHADHLNGLISVAKRYKIATFATEKLKNNTATFRALMDELKNQNIKMQYLYAEDRFVFGDGVILNIVGPSRKFLEQTSPGGLIGERSEFANIESLFIYKDFSVLLTGDSQAVEIKEALLSRAWLRQAKKDSDTIDVLQIPHHGSKTGLSSEILSFLKPELAVISVGESNKYGHPAASTLEILRKKPASPAGEDIKILRTDRDGEIEIVTDGIKWEAKIKAKN